MRISMKADATEAEALAVIAWLRARGFKTYREATSSPPVIAAVGGEQPLDRPGLAALSGVGHVLPFSRPYKLASREFRGEDTVVRVKDIQIGGNNICVIAGPCSVEGEASLMRIARQCKERGAAILRGGAFKPRTSPYSFQGLGLEGLAILRACGDALEMPVCTEVMDTRQVELVERYADLIQVGARNMQNYSLLKELGRAHKPVLLKRGFGATVEEFLMSAEYLLAYGNHRVVLCERGVRSFETAVRYTLDVSCVPVVQRESHLPIIVDPSHAAGRRELVPALAWAGIAAGAHGLIVEVHDAPEAALSDGAQALGPEDFTRLMAMAEKLTEAGGRRLVRGPKPVLSDAPGAAVRAGAPSNGPACHRCFPHRSGTGQERSDAAGAVVSALAAE
jgi:3-deoxy-7-phosphoheptulonate synthase